MKLYNIHTSLAREKKTHEMNRKKVVEDEEEVYEQDTISKANSINK